MGTLIARHTFVVWGQYMHAETDSGLSCLALKGNSGVSHVNGCFTYGMVAYRLDYYFVECPLKQKVCYGLVEE